MEEAIVSFALERLGDLLIQEAIFLRGVKGKVEEIQTELRRMQCFLKDADARRDENEVIRNRFAEIREAAYDAEDVIETFAFEVARRRRRRSRSGLLKYTLRRYAGILCELISLREVGKEIDGIKERISSISASLDRYRTDYTTTSLTGGGERESERERRLGSRYERRQLLRRTYSHLKDEDTVGIEDSVKILVKQLIEPEPKLKPDKVRYCSVVTIWGMGGLGKTTLARKVYHHVDVRRHFQHFAWISVSQNMDTRGVVQGLLIKLTSQDADANERKKIERMRDEEVFERVYEIQKKNKCLVILDDVWRREDWECLRPAFPLPKEGSKILLTTRNQEVAKHAGVPHCFMYQPPCLTEEQSWELLRRKAFPSSYHTADLISIDKEMENLGKKMSKSCNGLPLAVVVLGGLLATKPTSYEWRAVDRSIKSYLRKGYDYSEQQIGTGTGVLDVLALSYQDLPYHLKACFLYLAHFPEDYEIPTNTLVQMWMGEGIIALAGEREALTEEVVMEDVGEWYLGELIGRCMIQVGATSSNGRIKTCRLHDLMRDLCLLKAKEENFFLTLVHFQQTETTISSSMVTSNLNKVRRGAMYLTSSSSSVEAPLINNSTSARTLRSLLIFCPTPYGFSAMPKNFELKNFKLLRVLSLERLWPLEERPVGAIGYLMHLRYLSFKGAGLFPSSSIPSSSIGNLGCLQTLDLRFTSVVTFFKINDALSGMKWLRHLYLPPTLLDPPHGRLLWDNLSHLQTLKNFDAKLWDVKDLATLTKLRKLEMMNVMSFKELDPIFKPSNSLHSLCFSRNIKSIVEETDLMKLSSTCLHLYKLKLPGKISSLPGHHHLPQSLTELVLRNSRLEQDPIPILERLPNLAVLHLASNAYTGEEMVFSTNGFPRLKKLTLTFILSLKNLKVYKGTMPSLKDLSIIGCSFLEMIPEGLRYITTLDVLVIIFMPTEFAERLQVINGKEGEDFYKVKHVPSISFYSRSAMKETYHSHSFETQRPHRPL